ncbi:hypothetical protein CEXT_455111 [Caerostris extrusa]|uniref:Uncharacterized protein n=1 Tax=Caerostris extrusa TaxID=172846 RepID=A0AAV4QI19_CAEEX|nr:hypothetical protein CEXT_455111 [Caerostris extrusa]
MTPTQEKRDHASDLRLFPTASHPSTAHEVASAGNAYDRCGSQLSMTGEINSSVLFEKEAVEVSKLPLNTTIGDSLDTM